MAGNIDNLVAQIDRTSKALPPTRERDKKLSQTEAPNQRSGLSRTVVEQLLAKPLKVMRDAVSGSANAPDARKKIDFDLANRADSFDESSREALATLFEPVLKALDDFSKGLKSWLDAEELLPQAETAAEAKA